jgi:hypothetical protein
MKPLLYCALGIVVGLLINPYFPLNIEYSIHEVTSIFHWMQTDYSDIKTRMIYPAELEPPVLGTLTLISYVLILLLAIGAENYIFSKDRNKIYKPKIEITSAITLSVIFGFLYIFAGRFNEYWVPFATLTSALCIDQIIRKLSQNKQNLKIFDRKFSYVDVSAFAVFSFLILFSISGFYYYIQTAPAVEESVSDYISVNQWLVENTQESSIVFLPWSEFPIMFFYNTHNYYVYGLNPLDLYVYNETLSDLYLSVVSGDDVDAYQILTSDFEAEYLAIPSRETDLLWPKIRNDERFSEVYRNNYWIIYAL